MSAGPTRRRLLRLAPAMLGVGLHAGRAHAALEVPALEAAAAQADLHSLLVWQRGELLLQHYRTSQDQPSGSVLAREVAFGPEVQHDLRSITKSVVALLVGQAVGRGELDIATPVLDFYPELAALRTGPAAGITLAHLLDMACGLQWTEGVTTYGTAANDETPLFWRTDVARYLLDRPAVAAPGTLWNYNGGCTAVLGDVLQQRSGQDLRALAIAGLFAPLAITQHTWRAGRHGKPLAYSGLRLTPPDMVKIGRLMLDQGRWQGRQVVPAAWVAATLVPRVAVGNTGMQYGHHWWAGQAAAGGRSVAWTAGVGNGGQRLYVVPDLDLVVVMTAGQYNSPTIGGQQLRLFRRLVAGL